jgi:hypothetical protein
MGIQSTIDMNKEIIKKTFVDKILGGKVNLPKTADTKKPKTAKDDKKYLADKKLGAMPDEKVKIKDSITGKEREMMIVRSGTTDRSLGEVMLDARIPRERKDAMVAQYLFERGKESASFIQDIIIYKGVHSKETKVFKSQMRFDFEELASMVAQTFRSLSLCIDKEMNEDVRDFEETFRELSKKLYDSAESINSRMEKVKQARMAEKGYGVYVGPDGKPYSILDPEIDEIIKKERERIKEENEYKQE